jgi:hypothetical protein
MSMNQTEFIKALQQSESDFAQSYNTSSKDKGEINAKLGPIDRFQLNQAIEKRAGLRFTYAPVGSQNPSPEQRETQYNYPQTRRVWIPFFENPMITESRKANYASKKILLRNEPVRLYTGSEARKIKIDIHYSLIHMASMIGQQDLTEMFTINTGRWDIYSDTIAVTKYLQDTLGRDTGSTAGAESDSDLTRKAYERGHSTEGPWGPNVWWKNPQQQSAQGSNYWNFALMWVMRTTPQWVNHHKIMQKVINNIRSAVIGTQQMPVKGPPIVELKWGTMYNFTPCIVTDYKIQPIENAGYDTKSLTAQRLKVSLSLEEMRNINGNLWGNPEIGGDLPGWDYIARLGNIDPVPIDLPRGPITPGAGR